MAFIRLEISCQLCKVYRHQHTPLKRPPLASSRFKALHIDNAGLLPEADGYRYVCTTIDRFTRYPETVPMKYVTAQSCARALLDWISRLSLCLNTTFDRGQQFVSDLWKELWSLLGVTLTITCTYMPQQMIESVLRQLKA